MSNQWGLICAWDCATANVHDTHFQPLIAQFDHTMIVLTDTGFHAKTGDPAHMKVCPRGTWNTRMLVETVLSMLTTVFRSVTLSCSNKLRAASLPHYLSPVSGLGRWRIQRLS